MNTEGYYSFAVSEDSTHYYFTPQKELKLNLLEYTLQQAPIIDCFANFCTDVSVLSSLGIELKEYQSFLKLPEEFWLIEFYLKNEKVFASFNDITFKGLYDKEKKSIKVLKEDLNLDAIQLKYNELLQSKIYSHFFWEGF